MSFIAVYFLLLFVQGTFCCLAFGKGGTNVGIQLSQAGRDCGFLSGLVHNWSSSSVRSWSKYLASNRGSLGVHPCLVARADQLPIKVVEITKHTQKNNFVLVIKVFSFFFSFFKALAEKQFSIHKTKSN